MKRLKKGPELKMPALRFPSVLTNLYYDLRDRRLLPLIALVVVAIAAVPFLLGNDPEELAEAPPEPSAIAALKERGGRTSELTVVQAQPGLRDYRRRLRHRTPTDPFRRSLAKPDLSGAQLGGAGGAGEEQPSSLTTSTSTTVKRTEDSTTKTTTTTTEGGSSPPGGTAPSGEGGEKPSGKGVLYTFGVDLKIVHASGSAAAGDQVTSDPAIRKKVLPTTTLPGKETQVVTYMGLSPKTRKPLFLVSNDVTGVFGEGVCVSGSDTCQLIELEPGFPETFVYGEEEDRYRITVTKVEFVVTGHL